jgi:hypothetical protein
MSRRDHERTVEHFAMVPVRVLISDAFKTLPVSYQRVLWLLAAQYRGGNNGDLALTKKMAQHYGLNNERTRTHGLRELAARGLIVKTQEGGVGWHGKRPTLWALGWKPVQYRNGQQLAAVSLPRDAWADWREAETQNGVRKEQPTATT